MVLPIVWCLRCDLFWIADPVLCNLFYFSVPLIQPFHQLPSSPIVLRSDIFSIFFLFRPISFWKWYTEVITADSWQQILTNIFPRQTFDMRYFIHYYLLCSVLLFGPHSESHFYLKARNYFTFKLFLVFHPNKTGPQGTEMSQISSFLPCSPHSNTSVRCLVTSRLTDRKPQRQR